MFNKPIFGKLNTNNYSELRTPMGLYHTPRLSCENDVGSEEIGDSCLGNGAKHCVNRESGEQRTTISSGPCEETGRKTTVSEKR